MKTYSRKRNFQKIKYFDEVCRLCLSSEGEKQPIFSDTEEIPLPLKIMACVSIEVFEGDGLPSEICQQCVDQVENCYRFRQRCESTDMKLRQLIKDVKDEQLPTKIPPDQESDSDLHLLSESNSARGKSKSETSIKRVLYELLSDVNNSCKDMKYQSELDSNSCAISSTNDNSSTLLIDCEDRNDGLETTLVQADIIQNLQNVLQRRDCSKCTDMTSEQCTNNFQQEIMEEHVHKWQENNTKESQQIGEAIATGLEILGNERSSVIRLEDVKGQEIEIENPSTDSGTESNFMLSDVRHNSSTDENVENSSSINTVKSDICGSGKNIKLSETQHQTEGESSKAISLSNLFQLESIQDTLLFMCSKCPKRFAKRMDLKRHSSVHDDQRGFVCKICEKWFPNRTSFKRHERIHTGERPFACLYCEKKFSQDAILSRHIMTHTGEKPFKCGVCNKGFTQREGLRVHMRQHSSNKHEIQQHYCPLCEKSFCHQSGLSRHLVIHTGKTFDCSVCTKTFTDQSSLRRHLKRHIETQKNELT